MARTRTFFEDTTETCTYSVTVYPAIHTHGFLAIGWHVGVNLRTLHAVVFVSHVCAFQGMPYNADKFWHKVLCEEAVH